YNVKLCIKYEQLSTMSTDNPRQSLTLIQPTTDRSHVTSNDDKSSSTCCCRECPGTLCLINRWTIDDNCIDSIRYQNQQSVFTVELSMTHGSYHRLSTLPNNEWLITKTKSNQLLEITFDKCVKTEVFNEKLHHITMINDNCGTLVVVAYSQIYLVDQKQ
ncbi:unnamed protein product, partial [Didymodactylos carnosus]